MKLNDPFGRLDRQHQLGYESTRETMRRNNINTPEAAMEMFHRSRERALKFLAIVLGLTLPVIFFFPKARVITFCVAIFVLVWVLKSIGNARRYIQRYIDEDLKEP